MRGGRLLLLPTTTASFTSAAAVCSSILGSSGRCLGRSAAAASYATSTTRAAFAPGRWCSPDRGRSPPRGAYRILGVGPSAMSSDEGGATCSSKSKSSSSSSNNNNNNSRSKRPRTSLSMHTSAASPASPRYPCGNITACPKCLGEGQIRARPSKKARAERKRALAAFERAKRHGDDNLEAPPPPPPPRLVPCGNCDGAGIVRRNNSDDSSDIGIPPVRPNASVAIVGGGIGGLALALALQHRSVPCTVYERDNDFDERSQGYGLTMQQGARAVRSLGLIGFEDDDADANNDSYADAKNADSKSGVNEGQKEQRREEEEKKKFGITSKRHVVHRPDGTPVGQWGLRVWGRPDTKSKKEANRQNAHIARQELRRMLLDRLRPGTVEWGCRLVGYEECEDDGGGVELTLSRSSQGRGGNVAGGGPSSETTFKARASVLVGADGIRSAVRSIKLGGDSITPLRYLGCIVVLGITPTPLPPLPAKDSEEKDGEEEVCLTDGETVFQTADGTTRIYAMPFSRPGEESGASAADGPTEVEQCEQSKGRGETMWQLSFPLSEDDAKELSSRGPAALKAVALERCGTWHHPIPALLQSTPEHLVSGYPVYDRELPSEEVLRHGVNEGGKSRVTLIGDAAHPMSPFKGQGANQALLDAVLLARGLYRTFRVVPPSKIRSTTDGSDKQANASVAAPPASSLQPSLEETLAEFESSMLSRSAAKVKASAEAARFLHSEVAIAEGNFPRCTANAMNANSNAINSNDSSASSSANDAGADEANIA